jgi:hypothetical protein
MEAEPSFETLRFLTGNETVEKYILYISSVHDCDDDVSDNKNDLNSIHPVVSYIGYMLYNEGSLHNNILEKTRQTPLYQHLFYFNVDATY